MTVRSMFRVLGWHKATAEFKDTDGVATLELNGVSVASSGTTTTALATTLTAADGGKTFILNAAAGAAITLPLPAAGLKYKFVVGAAFATTDWTVAATSAIIHGAVDVNSTRVLGAGVTTVHFVNTAETIGDWVTLESDGTYWYLDGVGQAVGGITLA